MGKDAENMFPFLTSVLITRNIERVTVIMPLSSDRDIVAFTHSRKGRLRRKDDKEIDCKDTRIGLDK